MRLKITFPNFAIVSALSALCCVMNLQAGPTLVVEKAPTKTAPAGGATVVKGAAIIRTGGVGDVLREAYLDLDHADHDYSGHRIHAMKQIAEAAKLLGEKLGGDGKGGEKQGVSDEQLRAAQTLLELNRGNFAGKPLKHINSAINQLTIALKLK